MIQLNAEVRDLDELKVLLIGAHADDIEIGCGGTVLSLLRSRPDVSVRWVVVSADTERESEAQRSAERFLRGAKDAHVEVHHFRDGFLPWSGQDVKEVFEGLKSTDPDVIFTHQATDLHQDHRLLSRLTWNTFRQHLVLEYEVPKYDADLGAPNVFVPLEPDVVSEKIEILMEEFASQRSKRWFNPTTFRSLMSLRAIESPQVATAAEAFYARKLVMKLPASKNRP